MVSDPVPTPRDAKGRGRTTRRGFLAAGAGLLATGIGGAAYARWIEPTWLEVTPRDLPVPRLPRAWEGVRVALVADLHHCAWVPLAYLADAVDRVASLGADVVALAGDFVTSWDTAPAKAVADLFRRLAPPLGAFACLGNHDCGITRPGGPIRPIVTAVADALTASGVRLLRNEAVRLTRGGEDLWIAGVEEYWSERFRPQEAMRSVPPGAANLTLCHNPDAAEDLEAAGCGAILAGHTHGGQVQVPGLGPLILPVWNRQRYEGLHRVGKAWLYITRGVGWIRRVRFHCRPEISLLALRRAEAAAGAPSA